MASNGTRTGVPASTKSGKDCAAHRYCNPTSRSLLLEKTLCYERCREQDLRDARPPAPRRRSSGRHPGPRWWHSRRVEAGSGACAQGLCTPRVGRPRIKLRGPSAGNREIPLQSATRKAGETCCTAPRNWWLVQAAPVSEVRGIGPWTRSPSNGCCDKNTRVGFWIASPVSRLLRRTPIV
jgi:hypothetical protein